MSHTPCGTLGCPNDARWLLASKQQRFLRYFCRSCAAELHETGKFLTLIDRNAA